MQITVYRANTGYNGFADEEAAARAMAGFAEALRDFAEQVREELDAILESWRGFFDACFSILMAGQWLNKWLKEWRRLLRKLHILPGPQRRRDLITRIRLQNSIKKLPESVVARLTNGA